MNVYLRTFLVLILCHWRLKCIEYDTLMSVINFFLNTTRSSLQPEQERQCR